jgi:hypothetical protein
MTHLPFFVYVLSVCFLISLSVYFLRRNPYPYLKLFPPFLLVTIIIEIIGSYFMSIGKNNLTLYNCFSIFESCFYLWIITIVISSLRVKKMVRVIILFFSVAALVNIFFIQKMGTFNAINYSVSCLLVVSFCGYYFLELFRHSKWGKLTSNPAFWICSGLLIYYCCGFPLYGLINYWSGMREFKPLVKHFAFIVSVLNIFLYTLFAIAFLCVRTRKYTLSLL